VLTTYQAGGNLFATVKGDMQFNAYLSADEKLPADLQTFRNTITDVANRYAEQSAGRFSFNIVDPDANGGAVAQQLAMASNRWQRAYSVIIGFTITYW